MVTSGDSDWPGAYSTQLMADDVARLLDHLRLDSVTLLGHSLGGVVAYLVAEQRPDLVELLIVEDVTPPYSRDRPTPARPEVELDFDWTALLALRSEADRYDATMWEKLSSIRAPTLLLGGGPDSQVPQEKLEAVAQAIPDCRLLVLDAGHHVHRTRPEEFVQAVLDWLDRQA